MKANIQHIKITDLSIGYKTGKKVNTVAKDLNATANEGELICLLGANGTGKSTLLRTICRFQTYFSGQIEIMGKPIRQMSEKEISQLLSVVLTERISAPNATIYELVSYGRSPYTRMLGRLSEKDKSIVNEVIEQCGIAHKKNDLLTSISDGEKQKAFIAKAMAQDTPVIILDEPTAFLDLPARVEIIQLLRKVASQSGKSIILSTHDLDLALQMADKLWLLTKGGPLICGSPEDLLLQNSFQNLFKSKGLEFDVKTGLFKINYQHQHEVAVKGHGFEFVLLRRAFARNGVKTVPFDSSANFWVEIEKKGQTTFKLLYKNNEFETLNNVEELVQFTLAYLNCRKTSHIEVSEVN